MAAVTALGLRDADLSHMAPRIRAESEIDPDARVLRLATRQHGVVTRGQTVEAGMTKSMLEQRIRHGRLVRVHPAVYCVAGSPRTFEQQCFAAAAWGGSDAVVSHMAAARLWGLIQTDPEVSDVSVPRKRTRSPRSVRVHFKPDLTARDRGKLRGIPVTSPARTVIDLAAVAPEAQVDHALQRAIVTGCVTERALREGIERWARPGNRGPAVVRKLLRDAAREGHVGSPLEAVVAATLSHPELPPYCREHPVYVAGRVFYLDFAWPHSRVAVEADGRRWHSDAESFESDRTRQNLLATAGWSILRVTARQVRSDAEGLRGQVASLLRDQGVKVPPVRQYSPASLARNPSSTR